MNKILKPYTIIPQELYVQRDADKQVQNIINDMGRPGYVLVSRQMGKTNLLLNAKRNFEIDDNVFVYVDLSNSFDNAKDCFENIIDTAIDSNYEKFKEVSQKIYKSREEKLEMTPHKQHNFELRLLLQALNGGKMVIMLDEIDALTKINYSDQIFSQIRSSYFASRVNYQEFFNLTYLLSGVIEPNEIIKDSKISPFNIGQKIYLDDFSKEEFKNFITVASLDLDSEIEERIYFWTNGNPRMTWDVCSEIENYLSKGIIDISVIDKIVHDLYLITYDKPPIDNIRELVKEDPEIRNSIIEIEYKKGGKISDRIKSKLYLSGIINYNEKDVHIKNEILKQSISLEWIKSLEKDEKGLVKIAIEDFEKKNYNESLQNFEKFLMTNNFQEEDKSICYYYMGYGAYRLKKFDRSLEYLYQTNFDKLDESRLYYTVVNLKGLSNLYEDKIDESLTCFKEVIESGRKDETYLRSLINYGSISLKSDIKKHKDEAEIIFKNVINETAFNKEKMDAKIIDDLKSISHYNLGQIYSSSNDRENTLKQFELAVNYCSDDRKSGFLFPLIEILDDETEKIKRIDELITLILQKDKIDINEFNPDRPNNFNSDHLKKLLILIYTDYSTFFLAKCKPLFKFIDDKKIDHQIYDLAIYLISNDDLILSEKILLKIFEHYDDRTLEISEEIKYKSLRTFIFFFKDESRLKSIEYSTLFQSERYEPINYIDFKIFADMIIYYTDTNNYSEAQKYIEVINSVKAQVQESDLINYLIIHNLEVNLNFYLKDLKKANQKANDIISLIKDEKIKIQKSNLLGETGFQTIKRNAENIIALFVAENRLKLPLNERYGRHEIVKVQYYTNGNIVENEFKKLQKDIVTKKCFILN